MSEYLTFLQTKKTLAESHGIDAARIPDLNPALFDWQRDIVRWALRTGRCALFLDTGLGKTLCQLEWAAMVHRIIGGNVLILSPLAVAAQTKREADKFKIKCPVKICRDKAQVRDGITIANYEILDRFDPSMFNAVILDESSILKSFMGKTKRALCDAFAETPYRLCCTATPAPNDYLEIGNHSEFLGVMEPNRMLARWFINDAAQAGNYRLKKHAEKEYWDWVASWAICISNPADLGYDGSAFVLPELEIKTHIVDTQDLAPMDGQLFRMAALNATELHGEKRLTCQRRAEKTAELAAGDGSVLIWCDTNYEADAITRLLPDAIEVRGSDSIEEKEDRLLGFVTGKYEKLVTKASIAGFGINAQICNHMIFAGLSYSYEQFYQAIRRCWRFGQKRKVRVDLVMADTEVPILETVQEKERAHKTMKLSMIRAMRDMMIEEIKGITRSEKDFTMSEESGVNWKLRNGDSIELIQEIESDTIDFSIYSPPFAQLYIYSDSVRDMGNCDSDPQFIEHYQFLVDELYRVTTPGRLSAVHCKNLVNYKNRDGAAGLRDFRGEIIRAHERAGWIYHSEVTIWKCPVTEMQRTKAHGLLHKQTMKDSSYSRQGLPDYLIIFRKWDGEDMRPIAHPDGFVSYQPMAAQEDLPATIGEYGFRTLNKHEYSIQVWQRYASPVWLTIDQKFVLNVREAREDRDEKHICPLQLDVIHRALDLWSNAGDLVLSPFAGIGSEGYEAVRMGRRFVGIELKESYFHQAIKYLKLAQHEAAQTDMVTLMMEQAE